MSGAIVQDQFGRHYVDGGSQRYCFTVFTKMPDSKRGEYCEELDILAGSVGECKRIAKQVLKEGFDLNLRISRVERCF